MRDKNFVAEHRGGQLKKEQHYALVKWALVCVKHVLPLLEQSIDHRLLDALKIAKAWQKGKASVGDARNASLQAIEVARKSSHPAEVTIARAVGHTAATAHMADHSLRAAEYALKAIKASGGSVEAEQKWQDKHIPTEITELVLLARNKDKKKLKNKYVKN